VNNPFASILVRGVELLLAIDEAIAILSEPIRLGEPFVEPVWRAGVGAGASEAPRGILVHRYEVDDEGRIVSADIIPPTAQNQLSIEGDLRALGPMIAEMDDLAATRRAEFALRNHDPCISCATHFLTLRREGV
jgi:coenzyme F420-reducing hydrogenase alpha subunit